MLHNYARMWLASYVVHVRKVHWRAGADWLYGHLLDGDLASNHLSWQGFMVNEVEKEAVRQMLPLTVLYDGACPLCRREIGVYRGLQPLHSDAPVCFADVNDPALPLPPSTTRAQLLARFHVRGRDGELLSGAQAFLAMWAALPGWRWLALAGRIPGATWVMERAYRLFLRWRPMLQRWAFRLERSGPEQPGHRNAGP